MKRHIKKDEHVRWNLKQARLAKGLSLREVAQITNYSYGAIMQAERGLRYQGKKKDTRRDAFWETMSRFYEIPAEELMKIGDQDE